MPARAAFILSQNATNPINPIMEIRYKLDEVIPPTTTWSSTNGVGDPDHNWTNLVISVDGAESELARSIYCGEQDFEGEIP